MNQHYAHLRRKIDPTQGDCSPNDSDPVEIGPLQLEADCGMGQDDTLAKMIF